jgi:hypothetical protein
LEALIEVLHGWWEARCRRRRRQRGGGLSEDFPTNMAAFVLCHAHRQLIGSHRCNYCIFYNSVPIINSVSYNTVHFEVSVVYATHFAYTT